MDDVTLLGSLGDVTRNGKPAAAEVRRRAGKTLRAAE
jgi:hypothetical protein